MHESPRIRRLRNDQAALKRLCDESSIFHFRATGNPPHHYNVTFKGKGLCRDRGKIRLVQVHQVDIKLGASYPRSIPEIRWLTPIYHPNISEIGMVCLGGYGTHWVPSVQLDELCLMLWDMVRYHNYDIRSPYNREAALWVANQTSILFPTDGRPLRDLRVAQGRITPEGSNGEDPSACGEGSRNSNGAGRRKVREAGSGSSDNSALSRVRRFMEQYGRARGEGTNQKPNEAPPHQTLQPAAALLPPEGHGEAPVTELVEPTIATVAVTTVDGPVNGPPRQDDQGVVFQEWTDPSTESPRADSVGDEIVFLE